MSPTLNDWCKSNMARVGRKKPDPKKLNKKNPPKKPTSKCFLGFLFFCLFPE